MKRVISVSALLLLILAAGCEKQKVSENLPVSIPSAFSAVVKGQFGEIETSAELVRNGEGDYRIDFITPEAISPLLLNYKDGKCNVTFGEISFGTDLSRFSQTEMGTFLTDSIDDTLSGLNVQSTVSDGVRTYTGTCEKGSFTLTQNEKTGTLLAFDIAQINLHLEFTEFKEK